jgi:hypothetical protein
VQDFRWVTASVEDDGFHGRHLIGLGLVARSASKCQAEYSLALRDPIALSAQQQRKNPQGLPLAFQAPLHISSSSPCNRPQRSVTSEFCKSLSFTPESRRASS